MPCKPGIAGSNPAQGISLSASSASICLPLTPLPSLVDMYTMYMYMHVYMCVHVQTGDNLLNQGHNYVNYSEMSISPPLHISHHCLPLSAGLRDAFFETSFQQMFVDGRRSGRDDLLFYVMYDHNEDRDTVEFMRRDSKTLPRYRGTCTCTCTGIYTHSGAPWVLSWLCARQFMRSFTKS